MRPVHVHIVTVVLACTLAASVCVDAVLKDCPKDAVPCGISLDPCKDPTLDPCKGKPGHYCWREACGDDNGMLCSITCQKDGTVHAAGLGIPEEPTPPLKANTGGTTPNAESINSIPGIVTVPSSNVGQAAGSAANINAVPNGAAGNSAAASYTCPDGSPPVNCLFDPCAAMPCFKGTLCVSNYCGGCNTQCVCPDGSSPVNCLIDPCATKTCPTGQQCVSDYCGGCNAKCVPPPSSSKYNSTIGFVEPGSSTGPNIPTEAEQCPADKLLVDCNFNPCDNVQCSDRKVCKPTFCGTCGYTCEADVNGTCPYNACSRVRCEPSAYKTVCQRDPNSCDYRCVALQPPPCKPGTGYSATQRRCIPCKSDRVSSAGSNVCAVCGVDHYASRDRTTCLPCPPGYSTDGQAGMSRCSKVKTDS